MSPDATGLLFKAPTVPDTQVRAPEAEAAGRRPAEAPFAWVLARLTQPGGERTPVHPAQVPVVEGGAAEPDAAPAEPEAADAPEPPLAGDDGLEPATPVVRLGVMDLVVATLADLQTAASLTPNPALGPGTPGPLAVPEPGAEDPGAGGPPAQLAATTPDRPATAGPAVGPRDPALPEGRMAGSVTPTAASGPEAVERVAAQASDGAVPHAAGEASGGLPPPGTGPAQPVAFFTTRLAGPTRPATATLQAGAIPAEPGDPALGHRPLPPAGPAPVADGRQGALLRQAAAAPEGRRGTGERPLDAPAQQLASPGPATAAQAPGQVPVPAAAPPGLPGPEAAGAAGTGAVPGPEGLAHGGPDAALPGGLAPGSATDTPRAAGPAQQVAQQVAQSFDRLPPRAAAGSTVVSLAPAELGRVTIRLDPDPQNPVLHLTVERPETLELMRRNIDLLEGALRDLGRGDCTILLDSRGDGAMAGRREPGAAPAPASAAPDTARPGTTAPEPRAPVASGRLDLRL